MVYKMTNDILFYILVVGVFGSAFNLFIAAGITSLYWFERNLSDKCNNYLSLIIILVMYIPEIFVANYMLNSDKERADLRNRTTYMIEMPNNVLCEGTYWSGKNQPIKVKCVDGSFHVVNGIEVKYKMIDHKRVY